MLSPEEKHNFDTLGQAFTAGDVALMECHFKKSGDRIPVVCIAIAREHDYTFVPVALLVTFDPFENLIPPEGAETIDIQTKRTAG